MPWMITFDDEPSRVGLRSSHTADHLAYVRSIEARFVCSGALRETPDGAQTGGMWVLDVPTRAEAMALFEADPFHRMGLRCNVRVAHWTRGVWDGRLPA